MHRVLALTAFATLAFGLASCANDGPVIPKFANDAVPTTTARSSSADSTQPSTTEATTTTEPAYLSYIATARPEVRNVEVFDAPAGVPLQLDTSGRGGLRKVSVPNPLPSGAPATFLVIDHGVQSAGRLWDRVRLPVRPNGSTGWVAQADVELSITDLAATVHLSTHRLELLRRGAAIATYPVAVGTAQNPTPGGNFYVKELVKSNKVMGPYGPIAFGLSAFSPTLVDTEAFADGVIGIHGTNEPQLIGADVSHGCVRMRNDDILDLQKHGIPLGMPVDIVA